MNLWVPHLYGDLDEKVVEERGYDLISSDTDIWDDEDDLADDKKRQRQNSQDLDLTESWEVSGFFYTLLNSSGSLYRTYRFTGNYHD